MVVLFSQQVRPIVLSFFQFEKQKAGMMPKVFCVAVVNKILKFRNLFENRFFLENLISVSALVRFALRFRTVPGQNHFAIDPELKSWSFVKFTEWQDRNNLTMLARKLNSRKCFEAFILIYLFAKGKNDHLVYRLNGDIIFNRLPIAKIDSKLI